MVKAESYKIYIFMNAEIPPEVNGANLVFLREKSCIWKSLQVVIEITSVRRSLPFHLIIKNTQYSTKKRGLAFLPAPRASQFGSDLLLTLCAVPS